MMHLLRRIAIGNGNQLQKDAATAAMAQENQQLIARWNRELEEEVWQKIMGRIKERGYGTFEEDGESKGLAGKAQNAR